MTQELFLKKLGKRIRKIRKEKNISQAKLARLMDLPRQNINRLESGSVNPRIYTIYLLAKVLKVKMEDILKSNFK